MVNLQEKAVKVAKRSVFDWAEAEMKQLLGIPLRAEIITVKFISKQRNQWTNQHKRPQSSVRATKYAGLIKCNLSAFY